MLRNSDMDPKRDRVECTLQSATHLNLKMYAVITYTGCQGLARPECSPMCRGTSLHITTRLYQFCLNLRRTQQHQHILARLAGL